MRGYLTVQTFMTLATLMALRAQTSNHRSEPPPVQESDDAERTDGSVADLDGAVAAQAQAAPARAILRGGYWA